MAENDQNMPEPALKYTRTPEESRDVLLSWLREDMVFFAAGACHILAHMFLLHNPNEDFDLIYAKPVNKQPGNHMYVSGGTWAFDFNRWSLEKDLLKVNETFAKDRYPNWNYERIVTKEGLPEYLKNSHHLRAPEYFPELPWKRSYDYIHKLPSAAPELGVA